MAGTPQVFLHIGEPKTGTTFLQQVMWGNRAELASHGILLPGHHGQDHYRASQDLRGIQKLASDPAGSWTGEWDILAAQARQAPRASVISHELFCAADAEQAERAVASLRPADVHVVLTVRDLATLLPAEWQETVKHRNARTWEDWLGDVIDRESPGPDRRQWWFWRVHDTLAILGIWARYVPADRVHVITMPPRGSSAGLLWERFAAVLGVDPACADTSRARPNVSLGLADVEFLRRLNEALPADVPDWFYMWNVKEGVAHRAAPPGPGEGRLTLPAERGPWAGQQAKDLIAGLAESGYDIAGDLDELLPRLDELLPRAAEPSGDPALARPPAERVLDAAVRAAATLVANQYHKQYPAARLPPASPSPGTGDGGRSRPLGLASRIEAAVASSPRLKRAVRELSSRSPAVRRLRILAWRALERTRARRH